MFYHKTTISSTIIFSFLIISLLFIAIPCSLPRTTFGITYTAQPFLQKVVRGLAQKAPQAPETLEETETLGKRVLIGLPQALEKPWQEALVVWQGMIGWFKNFWYSYIFPWLQNIWYKINSFLGREIEKRKPEIKKELEKEKEEIKEEVPKAGKSLWQRFKKLIK